MAAAVALCGLMLRQTALLRDVSLRHIEWKENEVGERVSMATWRFWEDLKLAIGRHLESRYGPLEGPRAEAERRRWETTRNPNQLELTETYRQITYRRLSRNSVEPWQFWRTVSDVGYQRHRLPILVPRFEDPGRSLMLTAGFWVLGGVAPYLLVWLGVLISIPVLLWLAWEYRRARHGIAALVLLALCALSPYVVESLTLPHSAVGFYLVALLALVALSGYVVLSAAVTPQGLLLRAGISGLLFAMCTLARSGSALLLAGYGLVLVVAACRLPGARRARWGTAILAGVLLVAPYAAVRPTEHHAFWISIWEGLGDFASDRGYSWHDREAKRFMESHGIEPFVHPNEVTREQERFFRDRVLNDIREEPLWYLGVLARRAWSTLTLAKLRPSRAVDGRSLETPVHHYKYTTTADWVGLGARQWELPPLVLVLPGVLVGVLGLGALGPGSAGSGARDARGRALVVACLLAATLPLPVLISTSAGIEPQAVVLAYFLSAGFLIQELARRVRALLSRQGA